MRRRKKRRWNGAKVNTSSDIIIVMLIFVICQWLSLHRHIDDQDEECNCSHVDDLCIDEWLSLLIISVSFQPRNRWSNVLNCSPHSWAREEIGACWESRRGEGGTWLWRKNYEKFISKIKKPRLWRKRCRLPPTRRAKGCPTPPPCQDDAAGEMARCWGTYRSWRWWRGWSRRERRSWRAQRSVASQAGPTHLWGQYTLWDPKKFR